MSDDDQLHQGYFKLYFQNLLIIYVRPVNKQFFTSNMGNTVLTPARVSETLLFVLVLPALIILLSGDWLWPEVWLFSIWNVGLRMTCLVYLYKEDRALLEERFKKPEGSNQETWDKFLLTLIIIFFFAWIIIMPLDAKRFQWSPNFPFWIKFIGCVFLSVSFFFFFRAYTDNTFLSRLVRVQAERKQHVVSTGVYGFVRHPMYLGATMQFIGAPLLLGSIYGVLTGVVLLFILAGRIVGEEKMLLNELEGYAEYRKKVRYRLIPFVW